MRALVLVSFASGCSLLFDGGDLHGVRAHGADMTTRLAGTDLGGPTVRDLAAAPSPDMARGLAFAPVATYPAGGAADLAFGHFTTGAKLDAVLVGHKANGVYVLPNNGDGTFGAAVSRTACTAGAQPGKPYNLAVEDLDGDGHDDVAFTCNDTVMGQDHLAVLLNDGAGGLTKAGGTTLAVGNAYGPVNGNNTFNAVALAGGDFNHDGKRDLLVGYNQDARVDLFLGMGKNPVAFAATISEALPAGSQTAGIAAADLNGDGATDAALANSAGAPVLVASKPFGSPAFALTTYFPKSMYPGGAGTTVLGALSAGGRPDLLVVVFDSVAMMPGNQIHILRNDANGDFPGTPEVVPSDPATAFIAVADFDGDGRPDILFNSPDLGHAGIALQNADGSFATARKITVPTGIANIVVADVDGDGRPDIAIASATVVGLAVLLNRST